MECRAFASIGCLFVCVLVGGQAVAQTAGTGPVGKPIQLLQLMHPGNSAAKSHERSAAKHTSKSHPAAKKPTSTKLASKESTSNGAPHATAVVAAAAAPQVPSAPTSETAWSAAVKAIRADIRDHLVGAAVQAIRADIKDHLVGAAVQAIVAQNAAAVPTLLPGSAIAPPSELAIDSQTVRVASPDDANEIDLATDKQGAPVTDALVAAVTAVKATITETAAPADQSDSGAAAASRTPSSNVSSTSWLLRVMGALGTAVAVGSVAWFLIGPAPLRTAVVKAAPSVATPA
jgi:hypothetical protein